MQRALLCTVVFLLLVLSSGFSQANSDSSIAFKALYNFTNGTDGCCIFSGVARDIAGNLYGVAYANTNLSGYGDLFKLAPGASGYTLQVLQSFNGTNGGQCVGTPTVDNAGNIFGVCGGELNDGTLWKYSSQGKFSVLHTFYGPTEGMKPSGSVVIDNSGNIFGTAASYGPNEGGTLWKYSATGDFSVLHPFTVYGNDGSGPIGPTMDSTGKLWGVSALGPNCYACGNGTVWNYDPGMAVFTIVSNLDNTDIQKPQTRLALDSAGNFYGTAYGLGYGCGVVYELSPGNDYQPVILYQFTKVLGCELIGGVTFDAQGNIFGTTYLGGSANDGVAYELKMVNGVWKETVLHSFSGGDGNFPLTALTTDGAGNWFGTTQYGGSAGWGTVFEISGVK
jgi:uncharacterized repeat protein (TIGR03803 family)